MNHLRKRELSDQNEIRKFNEIQNLICMEEEEDDLIFGDK